MNTDLPNKVNEANQGLITADNISQRGNFTDYDANQVVRVADPIKDYYQHYQAVMNMSNSSYNRLTSEFTRCRNAWQQRHTQALSESSFVGAVSPIGGGITGVSGMSDTRHLSDNEIARLRSQVIQASRNFLRDASNDLRNRLNPGIETRQQIAREVHQERNNAMHERWTDVIGQSSMAVPDQESQTWKNFVSMEYDNIVTEKNLEPDSRGAQLIADITVGGKINEIDDTTRDGQEYKGYMKDILEKYEDFLRKSTNRTD
jgi:ribonuclease HIII